MRSTTIRQLKHQTTTVLGWVAGGESVEVRRHSEPVAVLSPPRKKKRITRPDFAARLGQIYGTRAMETTATDIISDARGDS
jgi:antitoxin (DNA-binding transcriptional repressor) of toxin-antitoxin stability system